MKDDELEKEADRLVKQYLKRLERRNWWMAQGMGVIGMVLIAMAFIPPHAWWLDGLAVVLGGWNLSQAIRWSLRK